MSMDGQHPIVVNIENSYQFFEHGNVEAAKTEAKRLATTTPCGRYVVYVPVVIYERTQPIQETIVKVEDADLPF